MTEIFILLILIAGLKILLSQDKILTRARKPSGADDHEFLLIHRDD